MSLRILHVSPYFADAWAYGGIPRLATTLAKYVAASGQSVTVCTTDACDRGGRLSPSVRVPGVDLRIFKNRSNTLAYGLQFFTPVGLRAYLAESVGSFDIAHIHGHRHLLEVAAAAACRRAGVPYVIAPNGTGPRHERFLGVKRGWDALWGRRDLEGAAAVVAVSDAEATQLRGIGVDPARLRRLPNPVDLEEFEPRPEVARLGRNGRPTVAFLGRITPRKRLEVAVAALARSATPGVRLVVGGNDAGGLARARAEAAKLGVADRVTFTGLLTGRDRLALLAAADVVVYPSADEVFGLVPMESLLCGTPVIVAGDSGCGELVGTLDGGQVVPLGDAGALAAALDRACGQPAEWRARAARGAAVIRERYAGPVVAGKANELYDDVLGR